MSQNIISEHERRISKILEWLWDAVAEPVLLALRYRERPSDNSVWPRVWWCPTGLMSFLPIHASGYHQSSEHPQRTVLDRVVSSYTSTITILKYSRERTNGNPEIQKVLIGATPTTRNEQYNYEPYAIRKIIRTRHKDTKVLIIPEITIEKAREYLPDANIAHFVCHAVLNEQDPSSSALQLQNGRLTVAEISRMKLGEGALAFLSACNTAFSSSQSLADENISLVSAFQIAGYARVVGTLWNANDGVALEIAKSFYQSLSNDPSEAARALHNAILEQRRCRPLEPSQWAHYIFVGP